MKIFAIILPFLVRLVKAVGTTALTPVLEKNIVKTLGANTPLVVSMSRLIVMGFAVVMLRAFWHTGIGGWPDAALGIAVVLALPLMKTLESANPDQIIEIGRALLARIEPSKFDNHRTD